MKLLVGAAVFGLLAVPATLSYSPKSYHPARDEPQRLACPDSGCNYRPATPDMAKPIELACISGGCSMAPAYDDPNNPKTRSSA